MTPPDARAVFAVSEATWPAAAARAVGPFIVRDGQGGGSRVSATTLAAGQGAPDAATLPEVEAAMRALGQPLLFQVRDGQVDLDELLEARGYEIMDPTVAYWAPTAALAAEPLEMLRTFRIWPPVAAQREIWAGAGIGAARLAVMARVQGPKVALLGRMRDTPAAVAFVACAPAPPGAIDGAPGGAIAVLHALETVPALRRHGMGRHVMLGAAHWAQAQGAAHLAVLVTCVNQPANAMYLSLGMQPVTRYHYRIRRGA